MSLPTNNPIKLVDRYEKQEECDFFLGVQIDRVERFLVSFKLGSWTEVARSLKKDQDRWGEIWLDLNEEW